LGKHSDLGVKREEGEEEKKRVRNVEGKVHLEETGRLRALPNIGIEGTGTGMGPNRDTVEKIGGLESQGAHLSSYDYSRGRGERKIGGKQKVGVNPTEKKRVPVHASRGKAGAVGSVGSKRFQEDF